MPVAAISMKIDYILQIASDNTKPPKMDRVGNGRVDRDYETKLYPNKRN
jgi:hypothetical protein